MDDILERINKIFRIVFSRDDLQVDRDTTAEDVEGWDSLQHINLISMMEKEFDIRFTIDQVISMENVGDMVDMIKQMSSMKAS